VLLAYDGLCTFEFGVAVELFGLTRPEMGDQWYDFEVASIDDGPVRATGGVRLVIDGGLDRLAGASLIIAPGWRDLSARPPERVLKALREAHLQGARLMSICSGAFLLAATGVLARRRAATHWRHAEQLARMYPEIIVDASVLYVDEGDVLTSAGSAAGIDLGLHLIRKDFGHEAANLVARRLVMPAHREGGQAQFIDRPVPRTYEGARLGPLFDRMRQRLAKSQPIPLLASEVGMSERTFLRRFRQATGCTPTEWLLRERLSEAKCMLETTARTMDNIATCCGLGTAANFRSHFRRHFRCSPIAYRTQFRAEKPSIQRAL
jgi:AraC family transcriptional activator FtrA